MSESFDTDEMFDMGQFDTDDREEFERNQLVLDFDVNEFDRLAEDHDPDDEDFDDDEEFELNHLVRYFDDEDFDSDEDFDADELI
jgi:hypothetical protein